VLDDVKGNWERRLSCLRRLQSLALGSLADCSVAPALVKLVRGGLVKGIRFPPPPALKPPALCALTPALQRPTQRDRARSGRGHRLPG
jgi:hypothetical protein